MKIRLLGLGWICLFAGPESEALALYAVLNEKFKKIEVDETNIAPLLRTSVQERKIQKADDFVGGRFGMPYNDFIETGKERFPPEIFRDTLQRVSAISIEADAIIAGFVYDDPFICQISSDGRVSVRNNFAAIGEGAFLATSVLLHREHHDHTELTRALYSVYEAKKYAERVPSVGEKTSLGVKMQNQLVAGISDEMKEWLENRYVELGPKTVPNDLRFDGEIFRRHLSREQSS